MGKLRTVTVWLALALIIAGFVVFGLPSGGEEGMDVSAWQMFADAERGISFRYPETFPTKYIEAHDWPPQIQITDGPFVCTEAGEVDARAGRTEPRTVGGRTYCVTEIVEGAAGSVYAQYAYAFEKEGKVIILTFTTRAPQCGNYAETTEMARCEAEQAAFNVDGIIDTVVQSFRFE